MLGLLWQKFGMTVEFPGATGNVVLNKTAVLAAKGVEQCLQILQMVLAALSEKTKEGDFDPVRPP